MVSLQRRVGRGTDNQNVTDEVTATHREFGKIVGPISGCVIVLIIAFSLYLRYVCHRYLADPQATTEEKGRRSRGSYIKW